MEILPDVKSLEDILVHSLAGRFKHALPADLKYLECLSCNKHLVLTATLKQSVATEDMNLAHLLSKLLLRYRKSGREASTEILSSMNTLSRKCVQQQVLSNLFALSPHVQLNSYSENDTYETCVTSFLQCRPTNTVKNTGNKHGLGDMQTGVPCDSSQLYFGRNMDGTFSLITVITVFVLFLWLLPHHSSMF